MKSPEKRKEKKKDADDSESDEDRVKPDKAMDYGYVERSYVSPEDDCFTKLKDYLQSTDVASSESNFAILHSRFSEIRRHYGKHGGLNNLGFNSIPNEHAHPCLDTQSRVAVFHNGQIANFDELLSEARELKIDLGTDKNITDSMLIASLIGAELDKDRSLKEALTNVVECKLIGTYRLAVVATSNAKQCYFVKNSGDFALGKNDNEIVVSTNGELLKNNYNVEQIPDNNLLIVDFDTLEYKYEKLEKKMKIERTPKAMFDHIMQEEIYESIDAVDFATDFGNKFISNH